jgi:hypothetical protein
VQHPEKLPSALTVDEILQAARGLPLEEAQALDALTVNLPTSLSISLTGQVEMNRAAEERLVDARELSSAKRNQIAAMPYKLMLVALARRIVYRNLQVEDARFHSVAACESRSITDFFESARSQCP